MAAFASICTPPQVLPVFRTGSFMLLFLEQKLFPTFPIFFCVVCADHRLCLQRSNSIVFMYIRSVLLIDGIFRLGDFGATSHPL